MNRAARRRQKRHLERVVLRRALARTLKRLFETPPRWVAFSAVSDPKAWGPEPGTGELVGFFRGTPIYADPVMPEPAPFTYRPRYGVRVR